MFFLLIRINFHGVTALLKAFQLPGKECDGGTLKLHPAPRWGTWTPIIPYLFFTLVLVLAQFLWSQVRVMCSYHLVALIGSMLTWRSCQFWNSSSLAEPLWASESCSVVSESLQRYGLYSPWNSPGQNTGVGSRFLLQGIFPTQGSNPGFPHCRQILCQLSHKGSPRIWECVAYPFSNRSSWSRNQTGVSCIAGGFFTNWAIRETFTSYNYVF